MADNTDDNYEIDFKEAYNSLLSENEQLKKNIQRLKKRNNSNLTTRFLKKRISLLFLGKGLKNSIKRTLHEGPSKENISEVTTHIIWRLFRIQVLTLLIGLLPVLILIFQTSLMDKQNSLFENQNNLVRSQIDQANQQNKLFQIQNSQIDSQNVFIQNQTNLQKTQTDQVIFQNKLLREQNKLLNNQNEKIHTQSILSIEQNKLVSNQNEKIEQQTILSESERRSSLIFLMSNVLDKLDEELKLNKQRKISNQLSARIIALSNSFKPYFFLENNRLRETKLSPERGQLLLTLMKSDIDSLFLLREILSHSNYTFSDLREVSLIDSTLDGILLSNSNFKDSELTYSTFKFSILENCDFTQADLRNVDFELANLKGANFEGADLRGANFKNSITSGINLKNAIYDKDTFKN